MEFFLRVVQHRGIFSWGAAAAGDPKQLIGFITCRLMQASEVQVRRGRVP